MAIVLDEPAAERCSLVLRDSDRAIISAATLTEALIVANRRGVGEEMARLIDRFDFEVSSLTEAGARRAARAHDRWGKGAHPAGLNFGDCFAYALAEERNCPLLFVGDDFARTDVQGCI